MRFYLHCPLLLSGLLLTQLAQADCQAIHQQANAATDPATLATLYEQAKTAPDCNDLFRSRLGAKVAGAYLQQIRTRLQQNPATDALPDVNSALQYARLWQALAMRGDLYHDSQDYYRAAMDYQEALEVIADREATPEAPAPALIGQIFKKAERSRLLADRYPPTPTNRSTGKPGGLAAIGIRGFIPEQEALPITFNTDSTEFDSKGQDAAASLAEVLSRQHLQQIRLIGHTDPRGEEADNLELSRRRAEAVKRFLLAKGYTGAIQTEGRGEREPLALDDPGQYTEDQRNQLHRRVELKRQ